MSKGKGNRNGRKGKRKGETEGKGNNANADVPVGPECSGHKDLATDSGKSSTASSNKKARKQEFQSIMPAPLDQQPALL